jgi:PAS domain S-box-containing protein
MDGGIRVLYVDDEPGLLEIARFFLEESGDFQVTTATSAKTALESPSVRSYDLILSDYQMPEMDGIAFLKEIRHRYGDLPFILFTGRGREEIVIEAINNGVDFYLQKGGDPTAQFAELAHKIRQAVARKKADLSRKKAELDLRESEEKYRTLVDLVPDAVLVHREGMIVYVNPECVRLIGADTADDLIGRDMLPYVHPDDRSIVLEHLRLMKETGAAIPLAAEQLLRLDGRSFTVEITARPVVYQGLPSVIVIFRDITERKKKEDELRSAYEQIAASEEELRSQYEELARGERQFRESQERLRSFMDSASDAFTIWDANLNLVDLNRTALSYTPPGTKKEDLIGRNFADFMSGPGEWGVLDRYREVMRTGIPFIGSEKLPDAQYGRRWLNVRCFQVGDGLGIVTSDITKEKETEEKLREAYEQLTASEEELRGQYEELALAQAKLQESQQQLAGIAGSVPGVIYQSCTMPDGTMGTSFISSRATEVFGISSDLEGFAERFTAQVDSRDRDAFLHSIRESVASGSPWDFEGRFIRPDGEQMWFQGIARPVVKDSLLVHNGVLLDITGRKKAEEERRESEEKFRTIFEKTHDAFLIFSDGACTDCNQCAVELFGYSSREEITSLRPWSLSPEVQPDGQDSVATAGTHIRTALEHGIDQFTWTHQKKDRSTFTADVLLTAFELSGKPVIFSSVRDITERRRIEKALRESEEKYRLLVEKANEAITILQDGCHVYANSRMADLVGIPAKDLVGTSFLDSVWPEDRDMLRRRYAQRCSGEDVPESYDFRMAGHDGKPRWVYLSVAKIQWQGRPATLNLMTDITERKLAETALRESEEKYRSLVEKANEGITILQDGRRVYVNPRMADFIGLPAKDLLGKSFLDTVWPEDREMMRTRYLKRCAGEDVPDTYDFRMIGPGGKPRWGFISVAKIQWQGRPATLNMMTDITERKLA